MNKKILMFSLFILSFLLIFSTVSSATDDTNQTDITTQYSSTMEHNGDEVNNENIKRTEKISKTILMDSTNFDEYVTDGKFNDNVTDGDTIDIIGKLDGSRFTLNVNKPVNLISSKGDSYWDSNTTKNQSTGNYNNIFTISKGGSGTNITGITFHNTQVRIENTSNVRIDNIKLLNIDKGIGSGVGAFTVREGSENITVSNSYFKTIGNGGHSNVVFAAAYNCLFENNTIEGFGDHGLIGNLLYLTTYNVHYATPATNINITIRNNTLRSYNADSYATCYGLVLEGKGHVIEGNIIDNAFPVMAQYAAAEYDFETNINGIIFNNNTIFRSTPQLVFPGIVSNNIFYGGATLEQVHAYYNTFNTVNIRNNVTFENNTAKQITISGNTNILDNNEIYSNEDYAVTITGENNTLINNKIASYLGRGENAITNSTEIIAVNNGEDISRVFYINDDNFEKYFTPRDPTTYNFNSGIFKDGDILVFNNKNKTKLKLMDQNKVFTTTDTLILVNNTHSVNCNLQLIAIGNILPYTSQTFGAVRANILSVINSTLYKTGTEPHEVINSTIFLYKSTYQYPKDNIYAGDTLVFQRLRIDSLPDSSIVYIMVSYGSGLEPINFTSPITIEGVFTEATMDNIVSFNEGSLGSVMNSITFKKNVFVNDSIEFNNCIFEDVVEVNCGYVTFNNCIFNSKITLNSANSLLFNNNTVISDDVPVNVTSSSRMTIENNTITTTMDNTIIFDDESKDNIIKDNILIANTLLGDDTVVGGENIVEDNGASYNTSIEIVSDDSLFKNDKSNISVTVYNLLNNTPVDKGYVEVYLDGILQGIKPLVNGQVTLEVNTEKSSMGTVPLKVWYYEGIRYANNVSTINVKVVKSNVSITVDEFTAKLNEKATVTAIFLNQNGNPVMDTNVSFTVGRSTYTTETVNGVATLNELVTSEWLDAGKITVTFPSTDAYNSNFTTITLNTSKDDVIVAPVVSVEDGVASIRLNLVDSLNSPVSDGKVKITTLDGQELASGRVTNGVYTVSVTLPEDYPDEYLMANYTGSYYYNDFVRNVKITGMLNSTIALETNSPLYGEDLIITGKLLDSKNNPIKDEEVTVNTDGTKTTYTTDVDGTFTHTYTPVLGVNNITVTFNGNADVYGTSVDKTITIRDTDRDMNEVLNQLDELNKANEQLQDQIAAQNEILNQLLEIINNMQQQNNNQTQTINELNDKLDNQTQTIDELNDKIDNLTQANEDLSNQLNDTTNNLTQQNDELKEQIANQTEIIDELNDKIDNLTQANEDLSNQLNDLSSPEDTGITFNAIGEVRYNSNVTVSGLLNTVKGVALSGQTVTLTIGNRSVDVVTNNGVFEYTVVCRSMGEQTVTAVYAGNEYYVASDASATFDVVKQDAVITVDSIDDAVLNEEVTITGTFKDANGKALTKSTVTVTYNGKSSKVVTDDSGVFTYTAKAAVAGENTVTFSYGGFDKFNPVEVSETFNVNKRDAIITIDPISDSVYKDTVTITGTFKDANGVALVKSTLSVTINGKTSVVKTDENGVFTITTKAGVIGENNITVSYAGYAKYNEVETSATFTVNKKDVKVTVTDIVVNGTKISITGKFTDADGKVLSNSHVMVTLNGKKTYVDTDSEGVYVYNGWGQNGQNVFTVGYSGSNNYNAYTSKETKLTVSKS